MDDAAGLADVVPDPFQELLAAQIVAADALGGELPLNRPLGGDAGVVGAGQSECWNTAHPAPAYQGVFDGFFQGVAQVQFPGDVGRGHDDYIGLFALFDLGVEVAFGLPVLVDALFNVGGIICAGHLGGSHCRNRSP